MNLLVALQASARVGVVVSAVPVAIGLLGFKARSAGFRWLWSWLAFGFGLNLIMMVLADRGVRTTVITQLTFPVFAALGLTTASELVSGGILRRWCFAAGILFSIFWCWRFLNLEAAPDFSVYTGPVLWMLLTMAAAAVIGFRLAESPDRPLRDPVLLAGLAILVSYAPGAAIEPVSAALYVSHRDLTLVLWICRSWLVVVGYILFSLVFLWTIPPRSSLGSSSSVV